MQTHGSRGCNYDPGKLVYKRVIRVIQPLPHVIGNELLEGLIIDLSTRAIEPPCTAAPNGLW